MAKSKSFVKNIKNISTSINSLLERNLNKLKLDNLKIIVSNNKIILAVVALFILFISYLSVPKFYKQGDISKELKNELISKFNLEFTFNQNFHYDFFPRPHFLIKESYITKNQKKIAAINQMKIYVSLDNLFSTKNININEVILEDSNFNLNKRNYKFFTNILDNNFLNANLKIKNSNIFFRNLENEVLFINKIKNLKYYYDPNELKNILYTENEIFNTPYSLQVINREDKKKLYTKINLSTVKLQLENIHEYNNEIRSGSAILFFNKIKSSIKYKTNKDFFKFKYYDESGKQNFSYNGNLNFKPFYSILNGSSDEINASYLFGTNAIIAELLKTEIFNNKNIDFKLMINANRIQNSRNLINLLLKSQIQDGLINIDNTKIEWRDNSVVKLTDTLILIKDGKLFLDGKSQINIINVKNIYKHLLTPKNFRKKIEKINFSFSYAFDEKTLIINDIFIDGKYNNKVNDKLINYYFRDSKMQNKIYFKNMVNNLLEAYAG